MIESAIESARAGRCLCGQVRFEARGEPLWVAHCHCQSCRRATSAAFATYVAYPLAAVSWSGAPRSTYASSAAALRSFCAACGSPLSYQGVEWPGEIHLFAASFAEPDQWQPQLHEHTAEQLNWVQLADGLPSFAQAATTGSADAPRGMELPSTQD